MNPYNQPWGVRTFILKSIRSNGYVNLYHFNADQLYGNSKINKDELSLGSIIAKNNNQI